MVTTNKQCVTPTKPRGIGPGGPLSPSRRAATSPKRRVGNLSPLHSPPLLRTPPRTTCRAGDAAFASHYSSDRFIPNRSALRVDICRASVESAERNLGKTFEKLSRRQRARAWGENGNPNSPASTPPPNTATSGASPGTPNPNEESTTPLQAEFNRRMRGALLNIPVDDAARPSVSVSASSNSNNGAGGSMASGSPSAGILGGHNRENVESVVYASMTDEDDSSGAAGSPCPPRRGMPRMLSFQGTKREAEASSVSNSSHRSLSSSSIDGGSITGASAAASTPKRRLVRQASGSSRCLSPLASPSYRRQNSSGRSLGSAPIDPFAHDQLHVLHRAASTSSSTRGDSLSQAETRLRNVTKSIGRRIPKTPSRILDAPELVDDYYLNLVSWSESNVLAVALGQCVYLWEADTGNIKHLLTLREETDFVTSVSWVRDKGNSHYIAIGTNHNMVQLWDAEAERRLRSLDGHTARVGALSWNQHWLSSGGRDSLIVQHDVRSREHVVSTYVGHTQEVCGLKWNDEGSTLASGGNENLLCLWDASMSRRGTGSSGFNGQRQHDQSNLPPRLALTQHKAAVKALAWCPFHRGLLASGGGTADRTIKFWNTNSGAVLNSIDTGSQVCSLLWSKHQREICSSHGFSENQLILWKYPTMTKIQEFKGHTARVLHMDQSPDGGCVVSAAADETLRFWDVFGSPPSERKANNIAMGSFCGSPMIR
ncbi:hypothetical protein ACHAXT_009369 [Thalassiosira profunda]